MTSEKYGVDTSDDEKTAQVKDDTCPVCRSTLRPRDVTGVRICPNCGSAPFESKEYRVNEPAKRRG